jgi:hypothetical protein
MFYSGKVKLQSWPASVARLGFCRFTRQSFGYVTNHTFAERLERAVAASERAKQLKAERT